jgi:hypothetical protein
LIDGSVREATLSMSRSSVTWLYKMSLSAI